mmetsp:Transcript_14575/g.31576  ORF Transcript_14575/g.31576 Transcript_14575/m.31576 type:complete len:261 (-) Transcript_14575:167-949(-)
MSTGDVPPARDLSRASIIPRDLTRATLAFSSAPVSRSGGLEAPLLGRSPLSDAASAAPPGRTLVLEASTTAGRLVKVVVAVLALAGVACLTGLGDQVNKVADIVGLLLEEPFALAAVIVCCVWVVRRWWPAGIRRDDRRQNWYLNAHRGSVRDASEPRDHLWHHGPHGSDVVSVGEHRRTNEERSHRAQHAGLRAGEYRAAAKPTVPPRKSPFPRADSYQGSDGRQSCSNSDAGPVWTTAAAPVPPWVALRPDPHGRLHS